MKKPAALKARPRASKPIPPANAASRYQRLAKVTREVEEARRRLEAYDQPGEAAEFYRLKRLPEGETQIPVERYFAAQEQMRSMPQYSTKSNRTLPSRAEMKMGEMEIAEWTPLGPGNIGGRTRALLINPVDPRVMYAAGVAGGVWKTVNGGATWTPLSDMLPNIAVNSMAMDPRNPNVIYAGTGEGFFNADAVRGAGIFKTVDGGATWARLDGTASEDFHYVNDIVVGSASSQRVYAATRRGVFRSLDGGATWTRALDPQLGAGCLDLAIRTVNNNGLVSTSGLSISSIAPGVFSANANGQSVAAAVVLRIKADGSQSYEPAAVFDQAQNRFVARPIDLGPSADQVFLILFGTGIRNRSALSTVNARIGGETAEVLFAGPQGGFVGLDQINLRLPRSLAGRGEIDINLSADGKAANSVRIGVR